MEILTKRINLHDKDSIRPGPVGSVGDVNLQVKLRKSAPDMVDRYYRMTHGKNEPEFGSNVSDGQYGGYTSGGMGAVTLTRKMPYRTGFKSAVGWIKEDVVPTDRSRVSQMGSLGRYTWDTQAARVFKAKTTGEKFLPLPFGYSRNALEAIGEIPRGSQIPQIRSQSEGTGIALPAAAVPITDPVFGENGSIPNPQNEDGIEVDVPACDGSQSGYHWTPANDDPIRNGLEWMDYRFYLKQDDGTYGGFPLDQPKVPQTVRDKVSQREVNLVFSACGDIGRPVGYPKPTKKGKRRRGDIDPLPPISKPTIPGTKPDQPTVPGQGGGGGETALRCNSRVNTKGLFNR